MKEIGVSASAPSKNNMSIEDELNSLTNFGMDEKQLLNSLNNSVNQSAKYRNVKNNINIEDIDNLDVDDDDLNDPELLVIFFFLKNIIYVEHKI